MYLSLTSHGYAAGVGGIITLVGTPPNIIVSGALTSFGYEPFSFFEFAWIGIPITVVAIAYSILSFCPIVRFCDADLISFKVYICRS